MSVTPLQFRYLVKNKNDLDRLALHSQNNPYSHWTRPWLFLQSQTPLKTDGDNAGACDRTLINLRVESLLHFRALRSLRYHMLELEAIERLSMEGIEH